MTAKRYSHVRSRYQAFVQLSGVQSDLIFALIAGSWMDGNGVVTEDIGGSSGGQILLNLPDRSGGGNIAGWMRPNRLGRPAERSEFVGGEGESGGASPAAVDCLRP